MEDEVVLKEEERALAHTQDEIRRQESKLNAKADQLGAEIRGFVCVDYEDNAQRAYMYRQQAALYHQAEQLHEKIASPYFARLDLDAHPDDAERESDSYYIGKHTIEGEDGKLIVIDWRSQVGDFYNQKSHRSFTYNNIQYVLTLRRALQISDGFLYDVHTEYDANDIALEGDIVDPFLLTVLKDKRRKNRLTDIIRTIQQNQNQIIRKPLGYPFVLQGCAGSGKTMILLHRLSYLHFNHPNLNFDSFRIITPNHFFQEHIKGLSSQLELDRIRRMSVDEYYFDLLKRFTRENIKMPRIESEKALDLRLLTELYDPAFMVLAEKRYHDAWQQIIDGFRLMGIEQVCVQNGIELNLSNLLHKASTQSQLLRLCESLEKKLHEVEQERSRLKAQLPQMQEQASKAQTDADHTRKQIELKHDAITHSLQQYAERLNKIKIEQTAVIQKANQSASVLPAQQADIGIQIATADEALQILIGRWNSYVDPDRLQMLVAQTSFEEKLKHTVKPIFDAIDKANRDYHTKAQAFVDNQLKQLQISERETRDAEQRLNEKIGALNERRSKNSDAARAKLDELNGVLEKLQQENDELQHVDLSFYTYEGFKTAPDSTYKKSVLQACSLEIERVRSTESVLNSIPKYNIPKRNNTRRLLLQLQEELSIAIKKTISRLQSEKNKQFEECKHACAQIAAHVDDPALIKQLSKLNQALKQQRAAHAAVVALLEQITFNRESYLSLQSLQAVPSKDSIRQALEKSCALQAIADIESRRQKLKSIALQTCVNEREQLQNHIVKLHQKADQLSRECESLSKILEEATNLMNATERDEKLAIRAKLLFANEDMPDVAELIISIPPKDYPVTGMKQFAALVKKWHEQDATAARYARIVDSLLQEQENFERNAATSIKPEMLAALKKLVGDLSYKSIVADVLMPLIGEVYKKYGMYYNPRRWYRHRIIYRLLFAALYYPQLIVTERYISIDEAQDLSVIEYRLMRRILGNRVNFELYGDVSQSVYEYKGISDWEDIEDITGGNIHVLMENYRNTLQITKYCNDVFGAQIYPIGINGEDVVELSLSEAVVKLIRMKNAHPGWRCAILCRYGNKKVTDEIKKLLKTVEHSWMVADDSKIAVLSVEMAKGLEFDAVVAVTDQMTEAERYVSFTRALDNLTVVNYAYGGQIVDTVEEEQAQSEAESVVVPEEMSENEPIPDVVAEEEAIEQQGNKEQDVELASPDTTPELDGVIADLAGIMRDAYPDFDNFTNTELHVLVSLLNSKPTLYTAPAGMRKTTIACLLSAYFHKRDRIPSVLILPEMLRENEIAVAQRLGIRCGSVSRSITELKSDPRFRKYNVNVIPEHLLNEPAERKAFDEIFGYGLGMLATFHADTEAEYWPWLIDQANSICLCSLIYDQKSPRTLPRGFTEIKAPSNRQQITRKRYSFGSNEEKLRWLKHMVNELEGQGIIYCDTQETASLLSRQLIGEKAFAAEAYIGLHDPARSNCLHYLTHRFAEGSLKALVSGHYAAMQLSAANLGWIIHYDMPSTEVYHRHIEQLSPRMENLFVVDLKS